ncbi:MAG: lytic transglycosylase domain-containing protein [Rhodospirillales bacterium]|nr:lytic transglycosylase domain-containing protein [Rhodospirillales bacterium]
MIGRLFLKVTPLAVAIVGIGLFFAVPAQAEDTALLTVPNLDITDAELAFPQILKPEDTVLYGRIFDVQESGDWKQADSLIARLENRTLMGHVLAQRYLHPTKYRSRYKELKAWMAKYADHPDAPRLYKLARTRQPKNWRAPNSPARVPTRVPTRDAGEGAAKIDVAGISVPGRKLNRSERRRVRDLQRSIRSRLRRGVTLSVKKLIRTKEVKRLFSNAQFDQAKAQLGQGYFLAGRDEWALTWAGQAAARSGDRLPEAHWTAGLAAWRLKKIDVAASHFEAVANNPKVSSWLKSAGAFWAARAHLVARRPERVNPYLQKAAEDSRTFYGLLANYMLGRPMNFRWAVPPLGEETITRLATMPRGQRAMALLQIGENRRAERELRTLSTFADEALTKGILALASRGAMPSLAVRLNNSLFPNGGGYDGAAYPLPGWLPQDGLRVDRALIFALIRQESRFNPKAKSWAGARGLMQLMPRTASFVARDRRFDRHNPTRRTLFEPEVNLALGQKYIEILLADEKIKGDLFLMAAAWNGGPGNLNKWRRTTEYMNDPLFFIESIPSRETRIFIEKVLSNLWIYRNRLGQSAPSLAAIAAGQWPVYTPLGQEPAEVAENDGSRK